ncbi:SGNH/GDSL hydrolase family protein [Natronoflexus pectinivorans]|nr:SGNH/GDSL hydrolase family protein [Natronoflexus pectinivorans]
MRTCLFPGFLFFLIVFSGCTEKSSNEKWVGTWVTAPQLVEPHNMPPEPGLTNNTLRQIARVSIGGDSLRIRFSNEFSTSPVTMENVQIAVSKGGHEIDAETIKKLTFNNNKKITMQPGTAITSDPVAFNLSPRMDLAITIAFGETSPDVTGHPGSRTTSFLAVGNQVSAAIFDEPVKADRWYVINNIEVKAPESAGSIVTLGNSITDGRGSGTNKQNRWPDILSERLLNNEATKNIGVLNQGIGGNCVLRPCLGPSMLDRFERDVLQQSGVRWLIILAGVNDLGQTPDSTIASKVADELIKAYDSMIVKAHEKNIKVYGATILPFGESFYYEDYRETARNKVNDWIRNSGRFDAVIDFDKEMRESDNPVMILSDMHDGDFLHPNEAGYQRMGEVIDLSLFN